MGPSRPAGGYWAWIHVPDSGNLIRVQIIDDVLITTLIGGLTETGMLL